ncbi:FadR/GntR family transcriptional regulator [Microbacterium halophytorum]|uniref:FadR/GntR family transcriptional regulator n=1 Tax=Microbacterium halophytorum TaxID=2067568 RepID=UPI000CFB3E86|nr:FadR/GntR family transcriptional regulator [Microbacterium halophytorum]
MIERTAPSGAARRAPIDRIGATVLRELVDSIVVGDHLPGATMPTEAVLSEQFGVSRTVVRESMKRLQEKNMVTVAQGRGTTVNPRTSWNMLDPLVIEALIRHDETLSVLDDLTAARAALEAEMASAAAGGDSSDEELRAALEAMQDSIEDSTAFREADVRFHHAVMAMSGNALAENIARVLVAHAIGSSRFTGHDPAHSFELTLGEHERIVAAITEGDADKARIAMSEHILGSWSRRRAPEPPTA